MPRIGAPNRAKSSAHVGVPPCFSYQWETKDLRGNGVYQGETKDLRHESWLVIGDL
jgi:hypothetical protein